MNFVPQVPGEECAAAAPAARGKGEPCLDGCPRLGAKQGAGGMVERTAARPAVGMFGKFEPGPEGVERGEQDPQAKRLQQLEEVIPQLHHLAAKGADRLFEQKLRSF